MERYVKYLRKSRFDRDYAELSIEETLKRHEAILDKLAHDRGYAIAKTYYEVVSGESISARPEIQKMLEEVSIGLYAGVLVVDLERLARGNGADQAYISQVFQFSGTKIITPTKVYDPQDEFDEEYFEFGLFMSRREYKTINRRLVRGRESSASEGKYIGSIAPYGYTRVKIPQEKGYTLELDPVEAPIIQQIFRMYLNGSGTKVIANYLNDHGIPTRHGELWTYSSIANIIINPVYMGKIKRGFCKTIKTIEHGEVKKHLKHMKEMSDYTVYDGLHIPLVNQEDFMRAQRIRLEKKPSAKVKENFELMNPFVGLLYCTSCGKRVRRTQTSLKNGGKARLVCVNARYCHNASAYYEPVEKEIIEGLRTWLTGYKVKIDTIGYEEDIREANRQLNYLEQESSKLSTQLENAFDLVEQGVYSLETFQKRRDTLTASIAKASSKKVQIEELIFRLTSDQATKKDIVPQTEELLASYDSMTNEERNAMLKEILEKIEYYKGDDGRIVIDLYPKLPRF